MKNSQPAYINPRVLNALEEMALIATEIRLSVPSKEIRYKIAREKLDAAIAKATSDYNNEVMEVDLDHESLVNEKTMRIARIWLNLEETSLKNKSKNNSQKD